MPFFPLLLLFHCTRQSSSTKSLYFVKVHSTMKTKPNANELIPIVKLRQELGLTQQEFASALGITVSSLHKWETGKVASPRLTLRQVLRLLEMTQRPLAELVEIFEQRPVGN